MADNQELNLQAGAETTELPKRRGRPPKAAKPQGVAPEVPVGEDAVDYRHNAKRKNNPLAGLAAQNRAAEPPKISYAYNPHLPPVLRFDATGRTDRIKELLALAQRRILNNDEVMELQEAFLHHQPWLEWAGKRERKGFQVDPVALHIHERVSTQAILRAIQRQDIQRSLFADPEMDAKAAVEFYKHDVDWANRLILGDSLQVMASLARRENLAGQIQMIYLDPPYGIQYRSNFQPEINKKDVKEKEQDLTREPEMVRAYRDTWTLGVHSYLTYLKDRMHLCKELLHDTGSIFVQIGNENVHRLRILMDEVFGADNFINEIVFVKKTPLGSKDLSSVYDVLLWYRKSPKMTYNKILEHKTAGEIGATGYKSVQLPSGETIPIGYFEDEEGETHLPSECDLLFVDNYTAQGPGSRYDVNLEGRKFRPEPGYWKTDENGMRRLVRSERISANKETIGYIRKISDFPAYVLSNVWNDTLGQAQFGGKKMYVVQTSLKVIKRCMLMATKPGDLVFDPTCGSGSTAMVAEDLGRRWITCDTSRVALSLARQRLMTAKYNYYQLVNPAIGPAGGFEYKTICRISPSTISQNVALDPILDKFDSLLSKLLEKLNKALIDVSSITKQTLLNKLKSLEKSNGKKNITEGTRRRLSLPESRWEHWEVPFDIDSDWPEALKSSLIEYRAAWRSKMDEVNTCTAINAKQEELIDQPTIVKGITRVTGPFTVEAVMPPIESMGMEIDSPIGGAPEELLDTFGAGLTVEPQNAAAFQDQVLGLLRTGGVDFLDNKHVNFTRLDALQGSVLHAEGEWTLPGGIQRRVAVSIGPRVGNVSDFQVEKALRQANLKGYQDLLFTGFGFDGVAQAVIQENAEELEGAQTHLFLIRPDVVMGDLLKSTAASQLFTAMGLPRTKLERLPNEEFAVQMNGVDIYDPVTNALIPTGADKVAAWFVDSDYDGRCFCITQAFFPDKSAWEKIAKALKATVDEDRMAAFSGTRSLPFMVGKHQRVAVKVIDPRGNEVMAVHRLV